MSVNLRGRNIGMAEQGLHDAQISAILQQMACEGMAKHMGAHPLGAQIRCDGEFFQLARGVLAASACTALATHLHFAIAADCVGAAGALLEQTVEHLKTRRQFDRPLASFQALKHRCADLKVTIQAAEALLADYLSRLEGAPWGERLALARAAKSIASSAFRSVAEEAMQLHGGMSMSAEHNCHLFLKRALLNEQLASQNDACDLAVATMPTGSRPE